MAFPEKKTFQDDRTTKVDVVLHRKFHALLFHLFFLNHAHLIVFIDETCVRKYMVRKYGRSLRGTRLFFKARRRCKQYTLVCAMSLQGIDVQWVFPKGMTYKRWKKFITKHLIPALEPGRILVWDNLNIHYNKEALEEVRQAKHFVWFTPPYSPEGNPIEYMFAQLKIYLCKNTAKSAKELRKAVKDGLARITKQHIASYFFVAWGHILTWREQNTS